MSTHNLKSKKRGKYPRKIEKRTWVHFRFFVIDLGEIWPYLPQVSLNSGFKHVMGFENNPRGRKEGERCEKERQ